MPTVIVTAAARWHPGKGQGLEKLFRLTLQCENGGVVPAAAFEIVRETPATALVDAHKGFGYVTGVRAMRLAVSKAQTDGHRLSVWCATVTTSARQVTMPK